MVTCPERVDPRRTILGDHQRRWLLRGLDRSQARWNVLAQQVVMADLDVRLPGRGHDRPVVATELVGTSVSSGASKSSGFRKHLADNPHIRFFESRLRGYTRCTVLRQRWHADLRVVNTVERPGAPVRTLARYVVETGRPGAEQV